MTKTARSLLVTVGLYIGTAFLLTQQMEAQTLTIDSFDKEQAATGNKHPHFVRSELGYDIYFVKATVELSRVSAGLKDSTNKALRMHFDLPPYFGGNWASVHKDFHPALNLQGYQGLRLRLKIETPTEAAFLRITVCDMSKDTSTGDEMWWFDCPKELLTGMAGKWVSVQAPFDSFKESSGEGTRHNDGKLDLSRISAYEVNLVSESKAEQSGTILINNLRAYK